MKSKKCRLCKEEYQPRNSLQKVCSPTCAIKLVETEKEKKAKKQQAEEARRVRRKLKELSAKDLPKARRKAQAAFNAYIRYRDSSEPCISCQRHHEGQYHAGHYLSRGAHPELAFEELNCHKQCSACNNHLSGNIARYRINLIKKIGLDKVEWLEGDHKTVKRTAEELNQIAETYKRKLKELKND